MSECNYSKIENGYKDISISQLKTIAKSLDVSVFLLLAIAESNNLIENKVSPLSKIFLEFIESLRTEQQSLTEEDVDYILAKIKDAAALSVA